MKFTVSTSNVEYMKKRIAKKLSHLKTDKFVTVGIHEDEGKHPDSDMTNAKLGAILNYGTTINHPGGTSYGVTSGNKVRFIKKGSSTKALGVTKAHTITIPASPWLEPGVNSGLKEYSKLIKNDIKDKKPLSLILERLGLVAVGKVQAYMNDLKTPANAPSTIKSKGFDNRLIHTGELKGAVNYKVVGNKPSEGI